MNKCVHFIARLFSIPTALLLALSLGFVNDASSQVALVGSQTATTTTTTLTINKPAGLAVGDIMFANIIQSDNDGSGVNLTNATSTGWTIIAGNSIGTSGNNEWWGTLLYKIANASDVAATNFSFTLDGDASGDGSAGGITAFSGVSTAFPFDASPSAVFNTTVSDDLLALPITTATANAAVVMFGMNGDDETFSTWNTTSPGALTEIFDQVSASGAQMGVAAAWGTKASAGATGNGTAEMNDTDNEPNGAILIALRPANVALASPLTVFYNGSFTVPAGVSCVKVQTWGGGGGGGVNDIGGSGSNGAGGGGGGGYREGTFLVAENDVIAITVGAGGPGAANIAGTSGTAGGNSTATFSGNVITANGGSAGSSGTNGGNGGTGSFTGTVYGQVANDGGDGGDGDGDEGGGGGGGAGSTGAGGNGANLTAGTAGAGGGGAGGAGGDDGIGSSGSLLGGGGGGAGDEGGGGGSGAYGRVIITWEGLTSSTPGTITAGSPASSCTSPFNPPNISGDNPTGTETWSWQSSTDGGTTWATIGAATAASFDPGNITTTTQYRRIRSVAGECPGISNVVTYSVNTPPTAGAPTSAAVCTGSSVNIAGNPTGGSGTYTTHAWTITNAGGTGATNGANLTNANAETVTFSAIGLTVGTVTLQYTVTDNNGCTGTKTVTVTVNLSPTTTGVSICQGAASQNLTVTSACADVSGTAGPTFVGAGANVTGIGTTAWTAAGNIVSDNGSSATASKGTPDGSVATNYLQGTNFGFAIPSEATINGIQVSINRFASASVGSDNVQDNVVRLIKAGTVTGDNKSVAGNWATANTTVVNYGGASDLWGTTWTPAQINASDFGVALSATITRDNGTVTASVDYISVTVSYTIDQVINWYTVSSGGTPVQTESSLTTFNPVGDADVLAVGGSYANLNNTNTPGTYVFYAECSTYPECRTAANFVINNTSLSCNITGPDPVCANTLAHAYSAPGGMTTYAWNISGNGTFAGGPPGNVQNVSVNAGAAGSYTVSVTITDGNGCTSTCSKIVTVNANPTASISGTLSFCAGGSTTLTASGGTSYLWDDASTNDIRTITAAGSYTVEVTAANGCTDTETVMVTANTPATADAGGPYSTCGATPVAISATASGPGMWSGGSGSFASASNANTTYTAAPSEFGTTVTLTWTTNDPDGAGGCIAVNDDASLAVSGQEIDVKGNGNAIANGDVTPASSDLTDFGWTTVASGTITHSFIIQNSGSSSLTLTGGTPVSLSGPHMSDFTVTMQPASPVSPMGMTMFEITFDPSAAGMRNATVSIANNDCDEAPYTFDITGKGTIPQAISVFGNGNPIANRAAAASVSDDTDFGSVSTGGGMVSRTFTIYNVANGSPLSLTGVPKVTIADRDAADFTVTTQPASPIDGGGSTTFTIKFQPGATGLRTAIVIITHDDLPENPFVFTINGTGL